MHSLKIFMVDEALFNSLSFKLIQINVIIDIKIWKILELLLIYFLNTAEYFFLGLV